MKVFFHLLRRELRVRWLLFLCAPALGLLSWPFSAFVSPVYLAVAAVPLVMGAGWLVGGFGPGGRRGFELAKPISAWQLCAAKLAAILVVSLGVIFICRVGGLFYLAGGSGGFRPALVDGRGGHYCFTIPTYGPVFINPDSTLWKSWRLGEAPLAVLVLVGWIQTIAFAIAGRSWRSVVEIGALFYVAAAAARAWHAVTEDPWGFSLGWLPAFAATFAAIAVIAGWRSIAGGVLPERAHRRYSAIAIPGFLLLGTFLSAVALYQERGYLWTLPRLESLRSFYGSVPSPDGKSWLVMDSSGPIEIPSPAFRVDLATGEVVYLRPSRQLGRRPWRQWGPSQWDADHPLVLAGGYRLEPTESELVRIVDDKGAAAGTFQILDGGPVGEIRPGLLLVSNGRPESEWITLVIAVPSGEIVRRLEGYRGALDEKGESRQIWLVNEAGEPFDLESADAEPRRILPWRPRRAEVDGR